MKRTKATRWKRKKNSGSSSSKNNNTSTNNKIQQGRQHLLQSPNEEEYLNVYYKDPS